MPYSPVTVPADGAVLPASVLQGLADNAAYLYSIVSGINTPFSADTLTGASGLESSRSWTFRHTGRYLHYKLRLTNNETDSVEILLDEVQVYLDATNRTAPYTWSGYIDLNGIGSPPALQDFYTVRVSVDWNVNGNLVVDYFLESDATAL